MKLHRFFISHTPLKLSVGSSITIEDSIQTNQWKNVFRLKKNDTVVLCDNSGKEYLSSIDVLTRDEAVFVIKEVYAPDMSFKRNVTLYISLIKKDHFELALQKAVELGVSRIVPVAAGHSQYKEMNRERLLKIIQEASEQSGRVVLPVLGEAISLEGVVEGASFNSPQNLVVFDKEGEAITSFVESLSLKETLSLLIGPEGGWTDEEKILFKDRSIPLFSFGSLTLRAETATICACAFSLL